MPPCRRRSRTGKRGIITRRAKPKSSSTQRPPTRLRPPRRRTRGARRPTTTNAEFGMRNAESQWDSTRHDPRPDIPHSPFRIPHFGLPRRLPPDHHPPRLPARPACSHRRSRRPTGAGHHRARQPGGGREPRGRACERAGRLRRNGVVRHAGSSHPPPRARDHEPRPHREDPVLGRSVGARSNPAQDRKSTRLNSSHSQISYAVFCLKNKKNKKVSAHFSKSTPLQVWHLASARVSHTAVCRINLDQTHRRTTSPPLSTHLPLSRPLTR